MLFTFLINLKLQKFEVGQRMNSHTDFFQCGVGGMIIHNDHFKFLPGILQG